VTDPTPRPETESGDFVPARPPASAKASGNGAGPVQGARRGGDGGQVRPASTRLTVLSGPSAVGKSTVIETIRRRNPEVWLSISVTTRAPRPGEVHGREYFFVSEDEFKQMAAEGQLLEWARYAGNFYGTPKTPVAERLAVGLPSLLEVDVVGARQVRAAVPGALLVFLAPPSWDELVRRLTERGTESADVISKRLAAAKDELQAEHEFDITLVNTSVLDVCAQLVALLKAQPVKLQACGCWRREQARAGNQRCRNRRGAATGTVPQQAQGKQSEG
jgi:guanylate kinase